jgi:hypothetical protein
MLFQMSKQTFVNNRETKLAKMNLSQFCIITLVIIVSVHVQSTHADHRLHNNNRNKNNNNKNNNNINNNINNNNRNKLDTLASKLIMSMGIDKLPNFKNVS